jgi:hypothetical protein
LRPFILACLASLLACGSDEAGSLDSSVTEKKVPGLPATAPLTADCTDRIAFSTVGKLVKKETRFGAWNGGSPDAFSFAVPTRCHGGFCGCRASRHCEIAALTLELLDRRAAELAGRGLAPHKLVGESFSVETAIIEARGGRGKVGETALAQLSSSSGSLTVFLVFDAVGTLLATQISLDAAYPPERKAPLRTDYYCFYRGNNVEKVVPTPPQRCLTSAWNLPFGSVHATESLGWQEFEKLAIMGEDYDEAKHHVVSAVDGYLVSLHGGSVLPTSVQYELWEDSFESFNVVQDSFGMRNAGLVTLSLPGGVERFAFDESTIVFRQVGNAKPSFACVSVGP